MNLGRPSSPAEVYRTSQHLAPFLLSPRFLTCTLIFVPSDLPLHTLFHRRAGLEGSGLVSFSLGGRRSFDFTFHLSVVAPRPLAPPAGGRARRPFVFELRLAAVGRRSFRSCFRFFIRDRDLVLILFFDHCQRAVFFAY